MKTETKWAVDIVRYRVCYSTLKPLRLHEYPGSAWRGAFGHAFKAVACTQTDDRCERCPENSLCPYPLLFSAGETIARPYLLEPHAFVGYFPEGAVLTLDVVVLGWLNAQLALLCAAFERLGAQGLGMRAAVPLHLLMIQQQVGKDWAMLTLEDGARHAPPPAPLIIPPPPVRARVDLITPLKLKYRNNLISPEDFRASDLLVALARRFEACATILDTLPLPPEPTQWLADADTLFERTQLSWHDTRHYSSRQRTAIKLGGFVGTLWLHGPVLQRIWPWLWVGQWLHLGSSATIGFGCYRIR